MHHHHQSFEDQQQGSFKNMSHGCGGRFGRFGGGKFARSFFQQVPVNVREADDRYELFVYAPGLNKEDFKISLTDDVLLIGYSENAGNTGSESNWLRQEYRRQAFERRFLLSEKVDSSAISARYADGVLLVSLPKQAGSAGPSQEIPVA